MTHMDHMGFTLKSLTKYDTKRLTAKITPKNAHLITLSNEKRAEQCYFKALKTGFVENKGQSGPLSADSETQGKCQ